MEEEVWKLIPGYTNYEASTRGRIRNNRNGYILNPSVNFSGYLEVNISKQKAKQKVELVHRMITQTFLPNPENKRTVNHKDHNRTNNNLSNLEWSTHSEQSNHSRKRKLTTEEHSSKYTWGKRRIWKCDVDTGERIEMFETVRDASCAVKSKGSGSSQIFNVAENHEISTSIPGCKQGRLTAVGFKWEFDELRTLISEEWRDIDPIDANGADGYQISTLGRLRDPKGIVRSPHGPGYSQHALNGKVLRAHRLVALTFLPRVEGREFVNHIDGNKNNPVIDNLEWVTRSENAKHAFETGLHAPPTTKHVLQYDLEGKLIREFESIKAAGENVGVGRLTAALWRGSSGVCGGYIWKKRNGEIEKRINVETYKHVTRRVKQYDMNGVFIREYESMQAAQKEIPRLQACAARKGGSSRGFRWKYSNDNTPFTKSTLRDKWKKVNQYDQGMNLMHQFESVKAAQTRYPGVAIHWAINNSKISKGFRWGYA